MKVSTEQERLKEEEAERQRQLEEEAERQRQREEEYNRLVESKGSAESSLSDAYNRKDALQKKIDRLTVAKKVLGECYSDFSDVKTAVLREIRDLYSWKGSEYEKFTSKGEKLIDSNKTYYDNIDDARDAINIEISNLENEIYRQDGIIGELHSLINSIAHRIENLFN